MKIKRYLAPSMRLALADVRAEQGPEAVILSSRRVAAGVEVIAAVDYDETLISDANLQRTASTVVRTPPAAAPAVQPAGPPAAAAAPAGRPAARSVAPPVAQPAASAAVRDIAIAGMKQELSSMRQLLESELATLSWHDKRLRSPLQARILEELTALDVAPDVARAVAALAPQRARAADPAQAALALLARLLPLCEDRSGIDGGVIAVVGPTGAGKTTTIAKLAARWALRHGGGELALVTTDGYRIGGREQLQTYARVLGASLHAVEGARELAGALERLRGKRLVLIDTAGCGPRDARLAEQVAALRGAARARIMLALPAQGEGHALEAITAAFAPLKPQACILTKLDEAASLGAALSTAVRHRLPIAYLCNGQRVPEDLHSAHRRRVWLVRAAQKFMERPRAARDETRLAQQFGRRSQAHA